MHSTIAIALIALVPVCALFFGSLLQFRQLRTMPLLFQLIGTAGLMIVVLSHLCEGLGLFPWMGWGLERSIGHYLDLSAAIVGLALFPLGYLLNAIKRSP